MLEEQETYYLAPDIQSMLQAMQGQIPALYAEAKGTPLELAVRDADFFLTVALSLGGTPGGSIVTDWGSVSTMLSYIDALQPKEVILFSAGEPPTIHGWPE